MSAVEVALLGLWFSLLLWVTICVAGGTVAHVIKTRLQTEAAAVQWHAEHQPSKRTGRQIL